MKIVSQNMMESMIKYSIFKIVVLVALVMLLSGCSFHEPAPVVDHSNAKTQRPLTADGTYRVRAGDTMFGIAFTYGLDQRELARWNGIDEPYTIYPEQLLRLSAPASVAAASGDVKIYKASTPTVTSTRTYETREVPPAPANQKPVPPAPAVEAPTTKPPTTPASTASKPVATSTPGSKPPAKVADQPPVKAVPVKPAATKSSADPSGWLWPTNGRLLRGFVAGDSSRNGIDIAGNQGQDIEASASGAVVYSGNGLIGYGELIIIKHSDNMLSAYANNQVRLVKEGEQVAAGQVIAKMGRNDRNEQLLHFEIRTKGKPVNPLNYLPKK